MMNIVYAERASETRKNDPMALPSKFDGRNPTRVRRLLTTDYTDTDRSSDDVLDQEIRPAEAGGKNPFSAGPTSSMPPSSWLAFLSTPTEESGGRRPGGRPMNQMMLVVANRHLVSVSAVREDSWSLDNSTLSGVKDVIVPDEKRRRSLTLALAEERFVPLFLDEEMFKLYYNGYCNSILRPMKQRNLVVANRIPVSVSAVREDSWSLENSSLSGVKELDDKWITSAGVIVGRRSLTLALAKERFVSLFLDEEMVKLYCNGYCNSILWPLLHYLGLPLQLSTNRSIKSHATTRSMLDDIIDYFKFFQLEVKVLSMSRLGAAGAVVPMNVQYQLQGKSQTSDLDSRAAAWRKFYAGFRTRRHRRWFPPQNERRRRQEDDQEEDNNGGGDGGDGDGGDEGPNNVASRWICRFCGLFAFLVAMPCGDFYSCRPCSETRDRCPDCGERVIYVRIHFASPVRWVGPAHGPPALRDGNVFDDE